MEMLPACHLARDNLSELGYCQGGERRRWCDSGRVDDRGQWLLVGNGSQKRLERMSIGRVASGEGNPGPCGFELGLELGGARGIAPTTAGEQQVLGAFLRQPARHMRPQRPGAAGDQDRSARLEAAGRDGPTMRCPYQPACIEARGAQRELVFLVAIRKPSQKAFHRLGIESATHVDEPSPALGVFQTHHPAKAPCQRLSRAC
jgi:hypothetical protein